MTEHGFFPGGENTVDVCQLLLPEARLENESNGKGESGGGGLRMAAHETLYEDRMQGMSCRERRWLIPTTVEESLALVRALAAKSNGSDARW